MVFVNNEEKKMPEKVAPRGQLKTGEGYLYIYIDIVGYMGGLAEG